MKNNFIKKIYDDFVLNNFIIYDQKQVNLLEKIYVIWESTKKFNFFFKIRKFHGVYLYGSVGIGKTFILKLFSQNIPRSKKIHFNHLMIDLHAFINNSNKENAIEVYVKNLSKKYNLIFIDEMHIFNIVDALIIKKIFSLFKKYKIFILISSNFKPSDLYENGLQRDDFLPFVNFLENFFQIIHFKDIKDYRRKMLNQSKTYFTPINEQTSKEFKNLFDKFVDKGEIHIKKVRTKSRDIRFEKCNSNIVFCSFVELCKNSLAHEDYLNIAKTFKLIFISRVPIYDNSISDQCRRFISLIDMLYEQQCTVVLLAEQPISNLCQIKNLNKEFERTASRLYEMTIINSDNNEKNNY